MSIGTRATGISRGDGPSIHLAHWHSPKTAKLKACICLKFSSCYRVFFHLGKQVQRCRWRRSAEVCPSGLFLGFCPCPGLSFQKGFWAPRSGRSLGAGAPGVVPISRHSGAPLWCSISKPAAASWMSPLHLEGAVVSAVFSNKSDSSHLTRMWARTQERLGAGALQRVRDAPTEEVNAVSQSQESSSDFMARRDFGPLRYYSIL